MNIFGNSAFWKQTFASLGYRDFRLVWSASMIYHLGEWMEMAGLLWFVQHLTNSPFLTSFILFLRIFPMIILSIPSGLIADRMSRRNLMIMSQSGTAVLSIALAVLADTGLVEYWHLAVLSVLGSFASAVNMPARQSVLPNLVRREHLMNAISLDQASMMSSRLIGAPLAGFLLATTGVTYIFGIRAIGAAISALLLIRMPRFDPVRTGSKTSPMQDIRSGWGYFQKEPMILALVAMFALPMLSNQSYLGLLPVFSTQVLGVGAMGYGFLQMAPGVGSALSLVIFAGLNNMRRRGLFLFTSTTIMGLALLIFSVSRSYAVSVVMLMVNGAMNTAFMTVNATLIQELIPDEVRGRVWGWRNVFRGLSPIGSLMAGSIADLYGPPSGAASVGFLMVGSSIILLLILPKVRKLN